MNRLETSPKISPSSIVSTSELTPVDSALRIDSPAAGSRSLPTATFAPLHYESGYAYPLLVWLHGDRQSEKDLSQIMPHVSLRNYVAVAPRGLPASDCSDSTSEHEWASEQSEQVWGWQDSPDAVLEAEDRVFSAIELADERFNVHPSRVFLAGVGSGGAAAMRIALAHPERFAGVATFDRPLPQGNQPFRRLNRLRHLPLMLTAACDSRNYSQQRLCEDLRLLHSAGCVVSVRQHPADDELTTSMLADLDRWMMEIVCNRQPVNA